MILRGGILTSKTKRILIIVTAVVIIALTVFPFGLAVAIYEDNFGVRHETYSPMKRSLDEFDQLNMKEVRFVSNKGQELAGYQYSKNPHEPLGVVVIAHGLGGGGQNSYMDIADYFASHQYVVFAYDATGNDNSQGDSVKGIPQGLIDLDYAIRYVKQAPEYDDLPIVTFGHSWGAYSAGAVLNYHPDVKAVVMVAGFDKSLDIIEEEGRRLAGDGINIILPFMSLYERIKFGEYSTLSSSEGFKGSQTGVMIIHSLDDEMISSEKSYQGFLDQYHQDSRFVFRQFKDRGHEWVWYSDNARAYKQKFDDDFEQYINRLDEEFTPEIKADYLSKHLDKSLLYELDQNLMSQILQFYDSNLQ